MYFETPLNSIDSMMVSKHCCNLWLSIVIGIEYNSTCWGEASGSLDECNISEFTALVKIEGNHFWKLYKSVSKQGAVNRKNSLETMTLL